MKKLLLSGVVVMSLLMAFNSAKAEETKLNPKVDVSVDYFNMDGDTTYTITGSDFLYAGDRGKSELEFPIDTNFVKLGIHTNLMERIDLSLDYSWSVDDDAGTMKDTDWSSRIGSYPYVISKSDSEIDAKEWNFDAKYMLKQIDLQDNNFLDTLKIYVGGGYKHQEFDYDIKNVNKTSAYFTSFNGSTQGKVLDYEVEYDVWYISCYLNLINSKKNIDFSIGFEYGPDVDVEDKDDHILRSKLSTASGDGTYYKFAAGVSWAFWQDFTASVYYNHIDFDTDGTQNQYFYDGAYKGLTYSNIDWESDSSQDIFGVKVTYFFN